MENSSNYFVYVILCENNNYYTGITNNLLKRINNHKKGVGAKYTKFFKVSSLVTAWKVDNKSIALSIEYVIKSATKDKKKEFISNTKSLKAYYYSKRSIAVNVRKISKEAIKKINSSICNS